MSHSFVICGRTKLPRHAYAYTTQGTCRKLKHVVRPTIIMGTNWLGGGVKPNQTSPFSHLV